LSFTRIGVSLTDAIEPVAVLDNIESAVVGQRRHGESNQRRKRRLIIERCAQHPARFSEQRGTVLRVFGLGAGSLLARQLVCL
jgi:hypothetical protein